MKTPLLIEQHFHGCYGIYFNTASAEEVLFVARKLLSEGVGYIFPTLVTDTVENINRQIKIIKEAAKLQSSDMARICGIHLEGIFLNPEKKGIHNADYFMMPTVDNFKLVEDDFIKIITIAPELTSPELFKYLKDKGVKIQAGHCVGADLTYCDATTHTYNAMSGITHRGKSTALSALINDDIYTEIIADGVHVTDDALNLLFKTKQMNKILLISDCLPCTHSDVKEFDFAGSKIYFDGDKATSASGTIAGSTKLLPDIVKILAQKDMFSKQYISNSYIYHNLEPSGEIEWDEDFNIVKISY
ncbi:MAG: N-acetylglucosamine-6-phosphate deacetylase [Candidatus Gastranaerophilaceae bacterium]